MKTCRWDFISTHRDEFGVQRLCRVLGTSRSGYYRHLATADARTERAAEDDEAQRMWFWRTFREAAVTLHYSR